jgi:hypothetical protein
VHCLDFRDVLFRLECGFDIAIDKISVVMEAGTPATTFLQVVFRLVFCLFQCICALSLRARLGERSWKSARIEQKLIILLMCSALLADDPLFVIQSYFPCVFLNTVTGFFEMVFACFLRVHMVILFKRLVDQNRPVRLKNFASEICLFFLLFAGELFQSKVARVLIQILFIVRLIVVIVRAGNSLDQTDVFTFYTYRLIVMVTFCALTAANVLDKFVDYVANTSAVFVIGIVTANSYALILAYFHWPYEIAWDETLVPEGDNTPQDLFGLDDGE